MPKQKDLKRIVRSRMKKTGESYTTARLRVISRKKETDYATLAGMSDETVKKATGCDWKKWVKALDHDEAWNMKHSDLARHIRTKYKTASWWTQMVAVGYERIRGLRAIGQRAGGSWSANKSRTFPVPVGRLFDAFAQSDRKQLTVRKQTRPKTMRLTWNDDGSSVEVYFTSKGAAKSSVAIEHSKLPSKQAADRMKQWWGERLDALKEALTPPAQP